MSKVVKNDAPEEPPVAFDAWAELEALWDALAWIEKTKEKLSPQEVLTGLLDHGLFCEKVPPCFVSIGLENAAEYLLSADLVEADNKKLKKKLGTRAHDYIRYEALRDTNVPRHMGIPHPEAFGIQALAIKMHWRAIAEHCNRPALAASRIHVRHTPGGRIFEMNYKGDERFQHEEEAILWASGARYIVEADIASCFPSIYTHVIPWVLHGKDTVKGNHSLIEFAGNLLDQVTQNTRDRQTNGLMIGPHSSNIISEIILTQVDVDLQAAGYVRFVRHIDDYRFYAKTFEDAEGFVRKLGTLLRSFELSLNEKKTRITPWPVPSEANWRQVLNRFLFPETGEIRFSTVRSYLDLALECAQLAGKSSPLNYAIKALARRNEAVEEGHKTTDAQTARKTELNERARRLYTQETMNLALAYPYLTPLLDEFVFERFPHETLDEQIHAFCSALFELGVRKLYPDTIAHAVFLALKYGFDLDAEHMQGAIDLNDCVANSLLWEYANARGLKDVQKVIRDKTDALKGDDARAKDRQWLLIYQVWSVAELKKQKQEFLADLKAKGIAFFRMPSKPVNQQPSTGEQPVQADGNMDGQP